MIRGRKAPTRGRCLLIGLLTVAAASSCGGQVDQPPQKAGSAGAPGGASAGGARAGGSGASTGGVQAGNGGSTNGGRAGSTGSAGRAGLGTSGDGGETGESQCADAYDLVSYSGPTNGLCPARESLDQECCWDDDYDITGARLIICAPDASFCYVDHGFCSRWDSGERPCGWNQVPPAERVV